MAWKVGKGKGDITVFVPGMVMLGFGNPKNTIKNKDGNLYSRTFWLESSTTGNFLIFSNLEVCFITQSLADGVMDKLKTALPEVEIHRKNLLLTAQQSLL